jgi:hypothetical protein
LLQRIQFSVSSWSKQFKSEGGRQEFSIREKPEKKSHIKQILSSHLRHPGGQNVFFFELG